MGLGADCQPFRIQAHHAPEGSNSAGRLWAMRGYGYTLHAAGAQEAICP